MKAGELLDDAMNEIDEDEARAIKRLLKEKKCAIKECKKTLSQLEGDFNELIDTDIDDLELEDWTY